MAAPSPAPARTRARARSRISPWLLLLPGAVAAWLLWAPGGDGPARADGCREAIPWQVGEVDPRYGLSHDDVWGAMDGAARIWEAAAGRPLFVHRPGEGMPVELVYDARQRALEARIREEARLHAEAARLRGRRVQAQDLEEFNEAVEAFNRSSLPPFQAGEYSHDRSVFTGRVTNRRIRIYAVADLLHLQATLAHELGHALGVGHVAAAGAVMAEEEDLDQSREEPALTPADVEALRSVCAGIGAP